MSVSRSISRPLSYPLTHSISVFRGALAPLPALIKSLFSASEQGALYMPRPVVNGAQALFQNAAGTVPVTADGDPVGRMLDQSGNGNHATQTVSGSRLVYRTDGALHWLEFDGVDDFMAASVTFSQSPYMIMSSLLSQKSTMDIVGTGGTSAGDAFLMVFDSKIRAHSFDSGAITVVNSSGSVSIPSSIVAEQIRTDSDLIVGLSGTTNSATITGGATTPSNILSIGTRSDRDFLDGNLYSLIIRAALTSSDEIFQARQYAAEKAGITL